MSEYWRFDQRACASRRLWWGSFGGLRIPWMAEAESSSGEMRGRSEVLALDLRVEPGLEFALSPGAPSCSEVLGPAVESVSPGLLLERLDFFESSLSGLRPGASCNCGCGLAFWTWSLSAG